MSMTFEASSCVTLLFDFWDVHGSAGMVLSVAVVLLLTVFFELLKVSRVWLGHRHQPAPPAFTPPFPNPLFPNAECHDSNAALAPVPSGSSLSSSPSESRLVPPEPLPPSVMNSWVHHVVQALLHVLQVVLAYMLMLCVMSYNTWIFLGVIAGSTLGYFLAFPLLGEM
ncbi:probable low affinity copper uptake protein 2 [Osmerus mordax]|uniref:probable low affinity copper uptake protein 2 n=1 Tax=Osmerus mordax TaxID=8014 RepID=UPI00350F258F